MSSAEAPGTVPGPLSGSLRARLLQAALDALMDLDAALLLRAAGGREIARRAGASAASINHHFGSLEGLADAVTMRVYSNSAEMGDGVSLLIAQIRESHLPLESAYAMHGAEFDRNTSDPRFKHRLGLWALGGDRGVRTYADFLHEMDEHIVGQLSALLESWGRTLRDPLDLRTFLPLKTALLNGMTQRHLVDPSPEHRVLFQRATTSLDLLMFRVPEDRHTLDDRLAEIHSPPPAPGALTDPAVASDTGAAPDPADATRVRLLRAAADLVAARGLSDTPLSRVAAHAGVSLSTLNRYFPTRDDLAVAIFLDEASRLLSLDDGTDPTVPPSVPPPATAPTTPADRVLGLLTDLVAFAVPRLPVTAAYLRHLTLAPEPPAGGRGADPAAAASDPLLAAIRAHVAALDPRADDDCARLLLSLTLRRALLQPATSPARTARRALRRCGLDVDTASLPPPSSART